jgi:hypothetical protein
MSHYRSRHHLHLLHPLDALPCDGVDDVADPRAPIAMHRVPQTDDRSRDADHKGREDAGTAAVIGWRVGYGASSRKPKLPLNLLPDEPANLLEELPKRTRTTSATGGRQSSSSLRTPCPSPLSPAGFYVPEVRWSPRLLPAVWAGTHAERTELRPIRLGISPPLAGAFYRSTAKLQGSGFALFASHRSRRNRLRRAGRQGARAGDAAAEHPCCEPSIAADDERRVCTARAGWRTRDRR